MRDLALVLCCEAAEVPPTFETRSWDKTEDFLNGSRRGLIHVPYDGGDISMIRIDLASDCHYQRGYAHGYLLAKEIVEFSGPKLNKFYSQMVMDLFDPTVFPEPIQEILKVIQIKGAMAAPEVKTTSTHTHIHIHTHHHPLLTLTQH